MISLNAVAPDPISCLRKIEEAIVRALLPPEAGAQYEAGAIAGFHLRPYAELIERISSTYVGEPERLVVLNRKEATAYALYYSLINAAKVLRLLQTLPPSFKERPLRILDFGCGPGTASLAAASALPGPLTIVATDSSPAMRQTATEIMKSFCAREGRLDWQLVDDPAESLKTSYDLIIAANVLNEMPQSRKFAEAAVRALLPTGVLLIVEPALQHTTRRLMELRDVLLAGFSELVPLFPCTRRGLCPMRLCSATDWCHGQLEWERPSLVSALDALTGFNKHRIKYAPLVLQRTGTLRKGYRIVTVPTHHKFGTEMQLCGADFYGNVRLLKKHRSKQNAKFQKLLFYERALIKGISEDGTIGPDAEIEPAHTETE